MQTYERSRLTSETDFRRLLHVAQVYWLVFVQDGQMPNLRCGAKFTGNRRSQFEGYRPSIGDRGQAGHGMTCSEGSSNPQHRQRMHGQGTKDPRIAGQAGLRAVNVTQAWRKAERLNGTFDQCACKCRPKIRILYNSKDQ